MSSKHPLLLKVQEYITLYKNSSRLPSNPTEGGSEGAESTRSPFCALGRPCAPPDRGSSAQEVGLVGCRPAPARGTRSPSRVPITTPGEGPARITTVLMPSRTHSRGPCLRKRRPGTHSGCGQPHPGSASVTGWASVPALLPPGSAVGAET